MRCSAVLSLCASLIACGPQKSPSTGDSAGTAGSGAAPNAGGAGPASGGSGASTTGSAGSAGANTAGTGGGQVTPENDGPGAVFVHLFEWKWTDIALECETFLGPNGFAAVQVSPPSEHAVLSDYSYPWWQRYQPVSYALESRSGTRAEFEDMVARCKAAGVGIYVDAVINHMTAQASGTGSGGTEYTKYEYPNLYTQADFHEPVCVIEGSDYESDGNRVQNCELLSLSDLDTGDAAVRQRIAAYLTELLAIGVRGFRIDAAKHMSAEDIDAIIGLVDASVSDETPYYFLEVIDYGGEAIAASDYLTVGASADAEVDITEFRFSRIGDAFLNRDGQTLAGLATLSDGNSVPSDRAVSFINNHDTQRGEAIYYKDGPYYDLANVFLLAWPYGYPQLMSSFAFNREVGVGRDQGPPSDGMGNTNSIFDGAGQAVGCAPSAKDATPGTWVCEHRTPSLVKMMAFRKATAAAPEVTHFWSNGANQIAFGRGSLGFVVINREESPLTQAFQTALPEGGYCDVLADGCAATVSVDAQGLATISVPALGAAAFHAGARP